VQTKETSWELVLRTHKGLKSQNAKDGSGLLQTMDIVQANQRTPYKLYGIKNDVARGARQKVKSTFVPRSQGSLRTHKEMR
jgi:hypothetical protein